MSEGLLLLLSVIDHLLSRSGLPPEDVVDLMGQIRARCASRAADVAALEAEVQAKLHPHG